MNGAGGVAGGAAGGAAAAAAAMGQAIKASGAIVRLTPEGFQGLLNHLEAPLLVRSGGTGLFSLGYRYLTPHKGFVFYTRSSQPLELPPGAEVVYAKNIWVPR